MDLAENFFRRMNSGQEESCKEESCSQEEGQEGQEEVALLCCRACKSDAFSGETQRHTPLAN